MSPLRGCYRRVCFPRAHALGFKKQLQNEGERLALDVQSGKLTQEKAAQELNGKIVAHFSKQWMEQQKPMFESMKQHMKNDPTFPDTVKQQFIKGIDSFIQTNLEGNVNPQKIKEFNADIARGVRIFEGEKLQGNSSAFGVGTFNANNGPLNGIGNDTAASVQVPAGYIVKLCPDDGGNRQGAGQCEEHREGTHNLKHPRTASWVNVRLIDLPQLPPPPPMIASQCRQWTLQLRYLAKSGSRFSKDAIFKANLDFSAMEYLPLIMVRSTGSVMMPLLRSSFQKGSGSNFAPTKATTAKEQEIVKYTARENTT